MAVNLDSKRIDPHDPQFEPTLRNLQSNILKGHGRDHTVHIFLEFQGPAAQVKAKFGALARRLVTSGLRQRDETDQFKQFGVPGGMFGNVLLTAKGYGKLGLNAPALAAAFPEPAGDFGVQSNFKEGMQAHGAELNDPAPASWDEGYRAGTIDAMLLLADDDRDFLPRQARLVLNDIDFARVLTVERGDTQPNKDNEGIKDFGYVAGRSQPIYFSTDLTGEGPTDKWDPSEPLKRVLVPDRTVNPADCFGSYLVFRKLEQDVLHFRLAEQDLADALSPVGADRPRAGAMAVGLLFMCFQASIANQFAFMQLAWVNNEGFLRPNTGLDPVIGQGPPGGAPAPIPQTWHNQWGQANPTTKFSFGQFVTLKGGEFFFAPCIPFLEGLATA
jgi:deferrochelatase/peroxidase EfeB